MILSLIVKTLANYLDRLTIPLTVSFSSFFMSCMGSFAKMLSKILFRVQVEAYQTLSNGLLQSIKLTSFFCVAKPYSKALSKNLDDWQIPFYGNSNIFQFSTKVEEQHFLIIYVYSRKSEGDRKTFERLERDPR